MSSKSNNVNWNAALNRWSAILDDEPRDGDLFIYADGHFGKLPTPPAVLAPNGKPVPKLMTLDPAFDPGVLAPIEDAQELSKRFAVIGKVQAALRKHEGFEGSHFTALEAASFSFAVSLLRTALTALHEVADAMRKQRDAQVTFNNNYARLTELVEQCPTPFA